MEEKKETINNNKTTSEKMADYIVIDVAEPYVSRNYKPHCHLSSSSSKVIPVLNTEQKQIPLTQFILNTDAKTKNVSPVEKIQKLSHQLLYPTKHPYTVGTHKKQSEMRIDSTEKCILSHFV